MVPASLLAGTVALLLISTAGTPIAARADSPEHSDANRVEPMPAPRHPREKTYMKRKWGVEILFLRATAAGYMLEFRYKVLDPEKAVPLFVRKTKPLLIHQETGSELIVPTPAKTGALRNSDMPIADRHYWMFFSNPNKIVQPGDRVNLQIGEFAVEGLVVQ
jgi:hypothetical protein